jgi:hypothetical protein
MTALDTLPDIDTTGHGVDHYICSDCWPDYIPGRLVVAFCGTRVPDTNLYYDGRDADICAMCTMVVSQEPACYRCRR